MNYIVIGNDDYQVQTKTEEIVKQYLPVRDEFSFGVYDGNNMDWNVWYDDAMTFPLTNDYKVIVVENCGFLSASGSLNVNDEKVLSEYLLQPNLATIIIFCANKGYDSRKLIVKKLEQHCQLSKTEVLTDKLFRKLVTEDLSKNNIKLDAQALEVLFSRLPMDLMLWNNELNKLLVCPQPISSRTIEKLVSRSLNDDVFKMVNAILDRKLAVGLQLYYDMLSINTDPIQLIGAMASSFRTTYQVGSCLKDQMDDQEIAAFLGINEYRLKYAKPLAKKADLNRLLNTLAQLGTLDYRFKNLSCDRKLELELFIIRLLEVDYAVN